MSLARRAYLGAELPPDAEAFEPRGLRIAGVVPGGIAERAGIAAGDVIASLAGIALRDLGALGEALRRAGAAAETELVLAGGAVRAAPVVELPREPGATYGELGCLRTIGIEPAAPRALVVVLPGIACESVEHGVLADLAAAWARAGFASLRFDKRGVGDSEGGPCRAVDFTTELADARAVVAAGSERGLPLVVFGHSVGGIMAPLVAPANAAGVIACGTPVMPWLACLVDSVERQLALRGAPAAEIAAQVAGIHGLVERGELNGRSAAYHAQLAALDPAAAWRAIAAPVLVLRGEHDWVVRPDDQARIAELVRGPAEVVDLAGVDHLLGWHADRAASLADYGAGAFAPAIGDATCAWIARWT